MKTSKRMGGCRTNCQFVLRSRKGALGERWMGRGAGEQRSSERQICPTDNMSLSVGQSEFVQTVGFEMVGKQRGPSVRSLRGLVGRAIQRDRSERPTRVTTISVCKAQGLRDSPNVRPVGPQDKVTARCSDDVHWLGIADDEGRLIVHAGGLIV